MAAIKQSIRFRVNATPLNNNLNYDFSIKKRVSIHEKSKKLIQPTITDIIRANQRSGEFRFPFRGKCIIHIEYIFSDARRADWDNLITQFKPWQDCMVQMGMMSDDKQVVEAHILISDHASGPATVITLAERHDQ